MQRIKETTLLLVSSALLLAPLSARAQGGVSDATSACLECHASIHPGIVEDWKKSRMGRTTPSAAKALKPEKRRVSFGEVPKGMGDVVVGCAECHTGGSAGRADAFDHNGFQVHTVVSPRDCAVCHPVEVEQYGENLMSNAYGNLMKNPLYLDMVKSVTGTYAYEAGRLSMKEPDAESLADSCLHCHGTEVRVSRVETRQTEQGEMEFPVLSGWPNQGVGRINPDGSRGSCTSCHPRHSFSIAMARQPQTCSQCHSGPDVPAYKVYEVSKHAHIYHALGKNWDFDAVPWRAGKDFTAPTCATCHVSGVVSENGAVLSERTHRMNDRLPWRIFGLVYAHPHPISPDTSVIRNRAGLPLPTELTGEPAAGFLIDRKEQAKRTSRMQSACSACHSRSWVDGHFTRFENTLRTSNEMTLAATRVLLAAYERGAARGPAQGDSLFNEAIEKKWVEQWLFFANSTRYAAAMSGADYGVFANGRWNMTRNLREMVEWLEERRKAE